ncbi:MAG: LemA family protein [Sphingobacteriales bacterium 17-39-43]|uniref:LemA family protein n=1 Tax=Daejeonella sp. TaxID=2805397 RepID=UPI000BC6AC76|nr:LemA family protein [Daejeonella sp.]MCF8453531.1 LemA family protein [Pedobacter sp.]OYX92897.1 MAG: LemA family protein [Sphingobacteriia bacterium 35-40-5]OYZ31450.1 MAG: LemA family protein [Sphingobacteriales bacterium 16-39-50]OZA24744.1 MAG: LemA family protein [Sphingobacteriales bacterium 17-39-43]OZA61810.1 MAG: LemA family protein [Sphingobacteriales bacterium 39-40-5]
MKRIVLNIVAFFAVLSLSSCGYNSMVKLDEQVTSQWAQVENVYQRRVDLIPNLVSTVKGAANFEKETLTQVIEARAKATSVNVDPTKLTPESISQFQAAQGQLSQSLGRLLATVEAYPELKANQNFLELQAQLEGTENRITVERQKFNTVTQEYNSTIRTFPNNLTAGMFGFKAKGYFQAEAGANKAPKVAF